MAALQKGEKSAVEHAFRSMVFQAGGLPVNFVNLSPVKSAVSLSLSLSLWLIPPSIFLELVDYLVSELVEPIVVGIENRHLVQSIERPEVS